MANASLIPAFVNRGSGSFEKARDALASSGRFDIREVDGAKLEEEIAKAVAAGPKRILIAGGDGSIRAAAQAVSGTDAELAVLPGGTLNHFAKHNGIPIDPAEAAKVAIGTNTRTVDVGYANERVFLNTSSIGAYVTFVRMRDALESQFGYRLASLIASVRIFLNMPRVAIKLEVGGQLNIYRTPLLFVGVGMRELQLPHLGDRVEHGGRGLHVFVVHGRRPGRLLALALAAVARGVETVRRTPELDAYPVDQFTIDLRRSRALVAFDGETALMATPIEYRLVRDGLRIVVPEEKAVERLSG